MQEARMQASSYLPVQDRYLSVANQNAAAAAIEQGNWQAAGQYLQMASHETLAYKNCKGVYELMTGNLYEGIRLLKSAKAEGSEEAGMNLTLFFENNKRH